MSRNGYEGKISKVTGFVVENMSFSFGFSGDDIEDEEGDENDTIANSLSKTTLSESEQAGYQGMPPRRHTLEELLASLPSQISYNVLDIVPYNTAPYHNGEESSSPNSPQKTHTTKIYRRSLFDIRTQLMAEANPSAHAADTAGTLLAGLESGDLSSGIYEGGFKTWECALDLASLLIGEEAYNPFTADEAYHGQVSSRQSWEVIELGAGSAIPSLAVLSHFLQTQKRPGEGSSEHASKLKLTLCDYNEDVLRLATAPNIFLNYLATSSPSFHHNHNTDEGDLDIEELGDEHFIPNTIKALSTHVSVSFISGSWGESFTNLLTSPSPTQSSSHHEPQTNLLILASETIYSPSTIKTFTSTLLTLLRSHRQRGRGKAKAWIAAKKVYFGVGGGVDEFVCEVEMLGGEWKTIFESEGTGVGRVVLEVWVKG